MRKKALLTAALALVLALTLFGCGAAAGETVPSLTLPEQTETPTDDAGYEDDLDGLLTYLEENGAIVRGDTEAAFTEMSYREIGAIGGCRYRFLCGSGTVQAEFYEFDPENLDEKGQECLSSIRETGHFTVLGSEVEATLHPGGRYIMIYRDTGSGEANETLRAWVEKCFMAFKAP